MVPFSRCVLLWRLERGLSQAQLAQKARIPRPNLSDIERGKRDVSLATLRALAVALEVTPGVLADGTPPQSKAASFSREGLERIAQAAVEGKPLSNPEEQAISRHISHLLHGRQRAHSGRSQGPQKAGRQSDRAWMKVAASCPPAVLQSLLTRAAEKIQ